MKCEIIIAGFGGQGILTLGIILANAAVMEGRNATWVPSYGPEMRGGTANCHVILSDKDIGSAIVDQADILIALNQPSLEKFFYKLKKNGVLIINSLLIKKKVNKKNLSVIEIPLTKLSKLTENSKTINMIVLGILMQSSKIVQKKYVFESIKKHFKHKKGMFEINKNAVEIGVRFYKNEKD